MFNVTHIEGELQDAKGSGEVLISLGRTDYGQSLGPKEQRSFRFPMALGAEEKLGEYTLVARVYYMNREKEPFVTLAVNDGAELVPPLPTGDLARMVQIGLGVAGVLVLVVIVVKALFGGASSGSGGAAEKKAARKTAKGEGGSNEWLQGTLAGSENRSPKKTKRG